jgi:beta-glucanase (GH16 family)
VYLCSCWPVGGEIDILEAVGTYRDNAIFSTYHWGAQCGQDSEDQDRRSGVLPPPPGANYSDAFHNFTVYWNATHLTWAVDGAPFVSRTVGEPSGLFIPSWPLYTILNTGMCFWAGPQPPPRENFPVYMYVDSVRSWAWAGPSAFPGNFPIPYNGTGLQPHAIAMGGEGEVNTPGPN